MNQVIQSHVDAIYEKLNQSSRGGLLWDSLTFEERSFFCTVAKVGHKNICKVATAKKRLHEFSAEDRSKLLRKIQGLNRLTEPFKNVSRYEFK